MKRTDSFLVSVPEGAVAGITPDGLYWQWCGRQLACAGSLESLRGLLAEWVPEHTVNSAFEDMSTWVNIAVTPQGQSVPGGHFVPKEPAPAYRYPAEDPTAARASAVYSNGALAQGHSLGLTDTQAAENAAYKAAHRLPSLEELRAEAKKEESAALRSEPAELEPLQVTGRDTSDPAYIEESLKRALDAHPPHAPLSGAEALYAAAERGRYRAPRPAPLWSPSPGTTPAQRYDHQAEALRRERGGKLETRPAPAQVPDYADGLLKVGRALHHLDEALPGGQGARVRAAYMLLRAGTEELGVWLRARGLEV